MFDRLLCSSDSSFDLQALDRLAHSGALVRARRRVFRQLVEALLYERVLRFDGSLEAEPSEVRIAARDEHGRPVRYVCYARLRRSFNRVQLTDRPMVRMSADDANEATSIPQFLIETQVNHRADAQRLAQFVMELEQTVVKDAQSLAREQPAIGESAEYDDLESAVADGHPYHPSYKSRVGFDLSDNALYGPEFAPNVRPFWIAADASLTPCAAVRGFSFTKFMGDELGFDTLSTFNARIRARGGDPERYVLMPVHPWQWREQIVSRRYEDIQLGHILPLGCAADDYRPQQSIRTLANASAREKASLKLSLSILNTSTSRILAPHTVLNAAPISDWLSDTVRSDAYLQDELRPIVLREVAGAAYDAQTPTAEPSALYGALSCIWRQSVHVHLEAGERAVPWTALCWIDPSGRPFIEAWLQRGGMRWLDRVLEIAILPVVHLLVGHGIALESHAQNMLLIHRDGYPTRVALKDFHDGVRFSPSHLRAGARPPRLQPTPARHVRINRNSYLTTDDPTAVRDFMLDALFFINLGQLAMFLADHLNVAEDAFWGCVQRILSAYTARFPELVSRFETFDLDPGCIEIEKLANRRLFPETDAQTHSVPLPWRLPAG